MATARRKGSAPDRRWHMRKDGRESGWTESCIGSMTKMGNCAAMPRSRAMPPNSEGPRTALRESRDEMEERVNERTRDLMAINKELEQTMAQRQQLERELLEISEREKRRIGQDLHDIVCQELTAAALFLKSSANRNAKKIRQQRKPWTRRQKSLTATSLWREISRAVSNR